MHKITFISTIHKESGKCNADELCKIIGKVSPEVIFLEALDETYSKYQKDLFSSFNIYHKKLEISALQKYGLNNSFEYIHTLDKGLSDAFENKSRIVCQNNKMQELLDEFDSLASEYGFKFLNSNISINLQEQMRQLESQLINITGLEQAVISDIDEYENSMISKIYSYSKINHFNSAIFMCGVAHRKSIIEKMEKFNEQEQINLNWIVYKQ